jgi:hypothetical protein
MTPQMGMLGVLVFCATCALDYAHTNYVMAVHDRRRYKAAAWSVLQWCAATIGFVVAVKVSLYLLPFEALGLYVGTLLAVPKELPVPHTEVEVELPEVVVVKSRRSTRPSPSATP